MVSLLILTGVLIGFSLARQTYTATDVDLRALLPIQGMFFPLVHRFEVWLANTDNTSIQVEGVANILL